MFLTSDAVNKERKRGHVLCMSQCTSESVLLGKSDHILKNLYNF